MYTHKAVLNLFVILSVEIDVFLVCTPTSCAKFGYCNFFAKFNLVYILFFSVQCQLTCCPKFVVCPLSTHKINWSVRSQTGVVKASQIDTETVVKGSKISSLLGLIR